MDSNKYIYSKNMINTIYDIANDHSNNDHEYSRIIDIFFGDIKYASNSTYEPMLSVLNHLIIDGFYIEWNKNEIQNFIINLINKYELNSVLIMKELEIVMCGEMYYFQNIFDVMELLGSEICLERVLDYSKHIS